MATFSKTTISVLLNIPPLLEPSSELAEGGSLYSLIHEKHYHPDLKESLQWAKEIAEGRCIVLKLSHVLSYSFTVCVF